MKRILLFVCCLVAIACPAMSDNAEGTNETVTRYGSRSYLLGIGHSSQVDTYLTPLTYTGPQLTFLTRIDRPTRWADGRIDFQSTFQLAALRVKDGSKRGEEWGAHLGYDAGWMYRWPVAEGLTLRAGGLIGGYAGVLYNLRNSNNPAQARIDIHLSATASAQYDFSIRRTRWTAMYQADLPVLGAMFSPTIGQSYYEISQGDGGYVHCAFPGNAFTLRQLLHLDFHLRHFSLRAGYLWDVRQSNVGGVRMHDISHSFVFGFVKKFSL